jgi:hypothetical protein
MQTTTLTQLCENASAVVAAAQKDDVFIVDQGKIVAVLSKPRLPADFDEYWKLREKMLADVIAAPGWDSTEAISEDRDRV